MSPFRPAKKQPRFADLKGILSQSKQTDNALYQTVEVLIDRLMQFQGVTLEEIAKVQDTKSTGISVPINIIVREIPSGVIDGVNATFTLANAPVANSEQIYLNGLLQDTRGIDYSISGVIVTFLVPPVSGDRVLVTYQKA